MLPPRNIFRSRWVALLWAAGILWLAYDVVSNQPGSRVASPEQAATDALGMTINEGDLAVLANALEGAGGARR